MPFESYQENAGGLTREQLYAGQTPEQLRTQKVNLLGRLALLEADIHIVNRLLGQDDTSEREEWIG